MRIALLSMIALLAGCASLPDPDKVDPNHQAYLDELAAIREAEAARERERREAYARMAEACSGDPQCVREVAREATLGEAFANTGGRREAPPPQPYVRPKTTGQRVAEIVAGNLTAGLVPSLVQGAVAVTQSDNSAAVAISGNAMIRDIATGAIGVASQGLQQLPSLAPSYTAGGAIVMGDQQTGDNTSVGRDQWGSDNRVGDEFGDINTGTQVESGIAGNGNRQASPDDNSERTECTGPGCQGTNRPIRIALPPDDPDPEEPGDE